jgi:hypothetical protein
LGLKTSDGSSGDPEAPCYLSGLLTLLAGTSDQEGAVDRPHAQTRNVLNQELLNLLILRKMIIDDDRWDLVDPQ